MNQSTSCSRRSLSMSQRPGSRSRGARGGFAALAVLVLTVASPLGGTTPARAQDAPETGDDQAEAIAKVTQLNRQAIEAYQAKKVDEAQKILRQALALCDSSGLGEHPITARTHIHHGMV